MRRDKRLQQVRNLEHITCEMPCCSFPWKERAVFALRGTMDLDDMTISEIVEVPVQEIRKFWMNALFRLRELLPKDFLQGRKR